VNSQAAERVAVRASGHCGFLRPGTEGQLPAPRPDLPGQLQQPGVGRKNSRVSVAGVKLAVSIDCQATPQLFPPLGIDPRSGPGGTWAEAVCAEITQNVTGILVAIPVVL